MLEIGRSDGWAQELAGCLHRPVFLIAVGCAIWLLLWLARITTRLKAAIQPLRAIEGRFSTTPSGLRLQGVAIPPHTLQSLVQHAGISIEHFAVAEVELCWPSWQKRLPALRISGLRVQLLQQQAPEGPVACPAAPAAQQLELLEQLLWQGSSSSSSGSSWMSSRLASFALGLLDLQVSNALCLYRQAGELGPAQLGRPVLHQDGVALSIRMLCIEPGSSTAAASGGAWPPAGQPQHEAAAEAAGSGPATPQKLVSRLSVTGVAVAVMSQQAAAGGSLQGRRQPAAAAAAVDLAAALAAEGWDTCFVLLQQWQCSIDVLHSSSSSTASQPADAGQQASQAAQQSPRPAIALKYRAAGVLEGEEQRAQSTNTPASSSRRKPPRPSRDVLDVRIDMKSLVLLLPPAATAIASRLAARFAEYQQLSPVWAVRPSQPVSAAPALWWQHACTAVLGECRRRRAAGSMRQALARRQRYLALYRALHCRQPSYVQLPRALAAAGSKHRPQLMPAAAARAALQAAERTMTACEVATHRIFVALLHSRHLQSHPALQQQWLEALDGLGGFVDLIPGRGQGNSHSEPGLVVALQCPAVSVTLTSQQQQQQQLVAEVRGIALRMPDAAQAALVVQQVQVLLSNAASGGSGTAAALQVPAVVGLESYGRSRGSSQASQAQQQQSHQDAAEAGALPAAPRLSSLGRIYSSSLIVTYVSQLQVDLGPVLFQVSPRLALQALEYWNAVQACDAASAAATRLTGEKPVPIKQMVLDSYKRNQVALSFALSALLPVLDVTCPQLALVAPLRDVSRLDSCTASAAAAAAGADGDGGQQAPPGAAVELVARVSNLHASVGYNSSCYSSLLQQVDATADMELVFVQAAAQQQRAQFAAVWMHPDDVQQLQEVARQLPTGDRQQGTLPVRQSLVRQSFVRPAAGQQQAGPAAAGGPAPNRLPALSLPWLPNTRPFVPVVRLQQVWARLSTHVPTEPAVAGGEHTTAGCSAAGLLLFVSPWQVKLLLAAAEQLSSDLQSMLKRVKHKQQSAAEFAAAAGRAAASSAAQFALDEAQEAGSGTAAASKLTTAMMGATAAVSAANAAAGAVGRRARAHAAARGGSSAGAAGPQAAVSRQQQQQAEFQAAAVQASRTAANQASMSVLFVLPYCEVLCFADLAAGPAAAGGSAGNAGGHRYPIQPQVLPQPLQPPGKPDQLLQQWSRRIAPVASLVLFGLRAGTTTGSDGCLAARLHMSSLLLVNLQLLDLCKSPATMPSAAGVYLPDSHVLPELSSASSSAGSAAAAAAAAAASMGGRSSGTGAGAGRRPAAGPAAVGVSANYNAFVLSPFTARLTATYQAATLHRWQLVGLSRLAGSGSSGGGGAPAAAQGPAAAADSTRYVARGRISRRLLLRQRWQRVLELRAFSRSLDYGMFLLFYQEGLRQWCGASGRSSWAGQQVDAAGGSLLGASAFETYELLFRHGLDDAAVATTAATATGSRVPNMHVGWFGSRRGTRTSSSCDGAGSPLHSRRAPVAGAAAAAARVPTAGPGPVTPLEQPGSPCNWRRSSFNRPLKAKLLAAEHASSSGGGGGGGNRSGSLPVSMGGGGTAAADEALARGLSAAGFSPSCGGAGPQPSNGGAASHQKTELPRVVGSAISSSAGSLSPTTSGVANMQVFSTLRNLRAGSASLLQSAAQQLKLRQLRQSQQQQQQQRMQHQGGSPTVRLNRGASCLSSMSRTEDLSLRQQGMAAKLSAAGAADTAQQSPAAGAADRGAAGAVPPPMIDFLDRFAVSKYGTCISCSEAAGADWRLSSARQPDTPRSQQSSVTGGSSRLTSGLLQPQLAVTYTQQPAGQHTGGSARSGAAAGAAGLRGSAEQLRPGHSGGRAVEGQLQDALTVSLAHIKLAVGPHSVSMLLQLASCLMAAAGSAAGPRTDGAAANIGSTSVQEQADEAAVVAAARAPSAAAKLRMRLQLVTCHVLVNMESAQLPGSCSGDQRLHTKGLLSLLLLDAASSVQQADAQQPAEVADADAAALAPGLDVSCSVAHLGLQDLCACVEQRHVLSGADQPYKAAASSPGLQLSRSRQHAACYIMARASVPASSGGQPLQLAVSVHNPRVVLVRRFANNVLYVAALINKEVEAASLAGSAGGSVQQLGEQAAPAAASEPAVVLLHLTNVQIILPHSHACTTLGNKYQKAWQLHKAAQTSGRHSSADSNASSTTTTIGAGGGRSSKSNDSQEPATPAAAEGSGSSWTWGRQRQNERHSSGGGRRSAAGDASPQEPLHAFYPEVLLLQVAQITVAAPAAPELLSAADADLQCEEHTGCSLPQWMAQEAAMHEMLASSAEIVTSSSAQPAQQPQPRPQPEQRAASGTQAAADAAAAASAAAGTSAAAAGQQPHHPASAKAPFTVRTARSGVQPAAAVRHGVLMVEEGAPDAAELAAAARTAAAGSAFSLKDATRRLLKQAWAKVSPSSRRLVIRPGMALDAAALPGRRGAAGADAAGAGGRAAGQQPAGLQAAAAAASGDAADGAACVVAYCLMDLSGFELLAGRMQREKATSCRGVPQSSEVARLEAGLSPTGKCALTGLSHLITRTSLQAAVHEHRAAAQRLPAPAAAARGAAAQPAAAAALEAASPASVLALAAPDGLAFQMSASSYRCLMDTLFGNLMNHSSSFERLPQPPSAAGPDGPGVMPATAFNPGVKFGPRPGQLPCFAVTLSSSSVQGTLLADNRWWTLPAEQQLSSGAGAGSGGEVVPFVAACLQDAGLCVQMMCGNFDIHTDLQASNTEWRDVRMSSSEAASTQLSMLRRSTGEEAVHPLSIVSHEDVAAKAAGDRLALQDDRDAATDRFLTPFAGALDADSDDDAFGLAPPAAGPGRYRRATPPATTSPAHLYSRLDRQPKERVDSPHAEGGSVEGISSDEAVAEQQLATCDLFPALLQPSADGGDKGPDISVIRSLDELPAEESAHLSNKGKRPGRGAGAAGGTPAQAGADTAFRLHMGYTANHTITTELVLSHVLLQWPYLTDMSLVSAIINVFYSDWGAAPKLPPSWLQLQRTAWLYFNLVITDSQLFMPLLTPHMATAAAGAAVVQEQQALQQASEQQQRRPKLPQQSEQQRAVPSPFELLRDMVLKQAAGLTAADIYQGRGQPLEQLGLALTFGAFRFGYFYGGDGEAVTRYDVRNMAGFVRDRSALITNWLLPLPSASLELRQDYPLVEEHRALLRILLVLRKLLLWRRVRQRHRLLSEQRRQQRQQHAGADESAVAGAAGSEQLSGLDEAARERALAGQAADNVSGSYATSAANRGSTVNSPEQRLLALACEHAEELFGERVTFDWHNTWLRQSHAHDKAGQFGPASSGMFGVYKRKARSELLVNIAPITLRAAFSNISAWKTLQADLQLASQSMSAGLGMWPPRPDIQRQVLAVRAAGGIWPPPPTGWAAEFRRSSMRCNVELAAVVLMLCDDKPHSFGAPDVLQAVARGVSLVHAEECRFPRTAAERADRLLIEGGVGVNILNNSSSKWEVLVEPWPLLACLSDPINPLAKADRTLYGQVLSAEPLRVNFFPSSLLSIGDLLAFCKEVSSVPAASCQQQQQAPQQPQQLAQQQSLSPELASVLLLEEPSGGIPAGPTALQGSGGSGFGRLPPQGYGQPGPALPVALAQREQAPQHARRRGLSHTEAPPSIEEQMALAEGLTSRIPQRYLIQNLTGSHLWYWAPEDDPAAGSGSSRPTAHKRVFLAAHSMQELKVSPAPRRVRHLAMDGSLLSTGRANAISIQMAGSWLPLDDVAVDVVGKYRYEVRDPLGSAALPLLLDVLLVGRTKMLRLHSCLWLENNSGMRLEPVLQLGINCSMPVVLGPGDSQDSLQRLHLRPLKPREGRFLPAAAALGGLLFLAPEGHEPSEHDVLRLTPSLRALKELQQGYITCQSKPGGLECGPVHLAATIHLGLQTDPYFTTQNLVEVPRPGTLRRAIKPLEATIRISPTLQLTNGLPYDVLGWVVVPQGRDALLHGGIRAAALQGLGHGPGAAQKLVPGAGTAAATVAGGGRAAEEAFRVAGAMAGAQPVGQQAQAPAGDRLSGMSRVWGAHSRREAAMALAGIIQAARPSLQQGGAVAPASATAASHRRRNSLFGARGPSVMGGDPRPVLGTTSQQQPQQQQGLQTTAHSRNASSTATQSGQHSRAVSEGGAGPAVGGGSSTTGAGVVAGGAAAAAADDRGRQLAETCELLLLQRWCRDLLMEEFVTTLHLVLSPATAAAVDVTALWLLDLPALVALALGVLLEEFGWISKSFPQVFALLIKLEESLASTAKAAAAAAEDGSESPSAAAGAAAAGGDRAGGWQRTAQQQPQQQPSQQQQPVTVQMLPWPADQLPLVELLALLFWLQQHIVRLQLAPGAAADLYLDPQLDVYAAVRVPVLAMQSRPTLVSGGLATQAVGSDSLRLFYTSSLDASRAAQQQQLLLAPAGVSRHSAAGGGSGSGPAGVRLGLPALQVLGQASTVHEEVKARMTEAARLLAQLVNQQRSLEQQQLLLQQQQGFSFLLASTSAAGRSATPEPYSATRGNVPRLQSYGSAPSELVLPLSSHAADDPLGLRMQQQQQQPSAAVLLQDAEQLLPWFSVVVQLLSDVVQLALHEGATLRESAGAAGRGGISVGPADSTSCYYSCYSYSATTEGGRGSAGGSGAPGTVRFDVSPLQRSQAGLPEQLMMDLQVADTALALLGEALCLEAVQAGPPPAAASAGPATSGQLQGVPPSHEGDAASEVTEIVGRIRQSLPTIMPALCGLLAKPPADVERLFTQLMLDPGHTLTDKEVQTLLDFACQALADTVLPPPSASPTPELLSPSSDLSAAAAAGLGAAAVRSAGAAAAPLPTAGLAAAGRSGGGAPSPRARSTPCPAKLPPVWQDNVAYGGGGGVDGLNQQGSTVIYEDEPEGFHDLQLPWPSPPPPTPAGLSSQQRHAQQLEEDEQASGSGDEEAGSEQGEQEGQGVVGGSRQSGGSTAARPGPMAAAAAAAPLRGLRSLRALMTAPNLAGSAGGAGQAASACPAGASDPGAGPLPAPAASTAAIGGSGGASAAAEITVAGPVRPLAASGGGLGASDGGVDLPGGLRTSIERLWRPRLVNSSNDDSDEGSGDDAVSPMVGSSFRRRPGASVRALARNVRRAGVAPGRMVHQRLSTQLRRALEHQMQQLPLSASAAGAPEHWQGTLVQQGLKLASMHLQALGLGAVAAEVQEGRPGFCAPPALTVSLMHSGGKAKPSDSGSSKASRSGGGGGSATRQVLMTAAFWLDNRSGLNLVLSDLDRRVLRGLPGPGLKFTADVHSPGLPRDCAALESDEPDLAALLAAGGSSSASRPPAAASMGGSHSDLAQAAEAAARGAGAGTSYGGFGDAEGAAEEALARLQEVRPALLNEQAWLRFWVEEHVVVPAGSKPHHRSRRTFSFNRGGAGLTTNPGSSAGGGGNSSGGDSSLQPNDLVHAFRSEASGFFKISVTGSKSDIRVKGHKSMAVLAPSARQTPADRSASRTDATAAPPGEGFSPLGLGGLLAGTAASSGGLIRPDPEHPLVVPVQRLFEFAAEVWPAPADGPFRATKVVSIKSKFILFNDTGMGLEYKQKGTPDIGHPRYLSYGEGRRFAGLLQPQERVAFHWDNVFEPRQLLIRPAAPGWPWSGAFPLPDKEDYFGLRLRNRCSDAAVIIPVNSTVGRSGCVLITFKSTSSVPPYRIENRTKSVQLNLRQLVDAGSGRAQAAGTSMVHGSGGSHRHGSMPVRKEQSAARPMGLGAPGSWDSLAPGSSLPFAWDEITARHTVEVVAEVLAPGTRLAPGTAARPISSRSKNVYAFDLDTLQKQHVLELRSTTRTMRNTGSPATSADGAAAQAPAPGSQQQPQQQETMRPERQQPQPPEAGRQLRMTASAAMHARSGVFFPPDTAAAGSSSSLKSGSRAGFRSTSSADGPAVGSPRGYAAAGGSSGDGSSDAARAAAASASAAAALGAAAHSVAVFDRKVYVTVYADGPTKVLCFSDEEAVGAAADGEEGGTQQLMSRLHQVARRLMQADKQLAAFVGPSYNIRAAKNTRAVPASLLMQQQQHAAAVAAAAGGVAAQQPLAMQPAAGGWYGSSQTTMAAVAMLQKLSLQEMVTAAEEAGQQGAGRQAHHGHLRSTDSAHGALWAPAASAAAAAMRTGQLLMEADSLQGGLPAAGAQDQLPGAAAGAPAPSGPSASARLLPGGLPATQSHISSRALAGAAAAAGAGVRVDPVTGLLSADTGPDGGLKLYYDKLTLLLDSGLPLGGNCKVKLLSARGLGAGGSAGGDRFIGGCVARLAATGRPPVLSSVVQLSQRLRDGEQEVVWDHEELFTEVTALCELVVDLWGVPTGSILGGRRHHHGSTRPAQAAGKPAGAGGRAPPGSGAGGSGKGVVRQAVTATAGNTVISSTAQVPSGSIFLGTVNIPLIHTLPGTATAGRGPRWFSLLRRSGMQHVTGEVQLSFSWSFTRETLLACELAELERLLAARQEVLAMLRPLSAARVARLMGLPAAAAADGSAAGGEPGSGQARAGSLEAPMPAVAAGWNDEDDDDDSDGASLMSDGTADSSFVAAAAAAGPDATTAGSHQHPRASAAAASAAGTTVARLPSIVTCRDVFAGLDLGMADSSVVGLEVGVVEVANLSPRSGWSQDLTHALLSAAGGGVRAVGQGSSMVLTETVKRADLPLPVVYVFCGAGGSGDRGFEVSAGSHSLNPLFATNRFLFEHVGLRSLLRVQVYDRRSALDSRLLGLASLPAAAIPAGTSGPVYMWVPLLPPGGKKRGKLARLQGYLHGGLPAGASATTTLGSRSAPRHQVAAASPFLPHSQRQPLQVLLRLRVLKPPTHNTTAALQLNLAGMLLNAKADGGDELLNLSVDAVQCALLNTTRQRQLTLSVLRLQLDNQTLATRHPVVLSPATMGEEAVTRSEPILATDKTLDDMDSPARALMAALSRPVPKPGSITGLGAAAGSAAAGSSARAASSSTAAAAGIRQLQLASSGSSGVGALGSKSPLIRLSVCQTLTKPLAGTGRSGSEPGAISASSSAADVAAATAAAGPSGALPHAASSASLAATAAAAAAAGTSGGGASAAESAVSKAAIVSFKKVELLIGAMDIKTDQSFLEAVYIFMQSMPLPDLWQDEAWQHHVALLQGTTAEAADADAAASPAAAVAARPLTAAAGAGAGAGPLVARQQQLSASAANRLAGHARTRSFRAPAAFLDQLDLTALQLAAQAQAGPAWPPAVLPAAVVVPPAAAGGPSFGGGQLLPAAGSASAGGAGGGGRAARRAAAAQRAALSSALVLAWLPGKNDTELASMKGQSSTWLFFEAFHISSICVNVTIALTSSFRTAAGGQPGSGSGSLAPGLRADGSRASDAAGEDGGWRIDGPGRAGLSAAGMLTEVQRGVVRSMVNRVSGNSGLQLINVSDVGLTLGGVELSNRLLNQVGLRSYLVRHYTWRAVAQARKVLGGAGPGLAQVPASIIWAGFSVFDIGREVTRGKRSPLHFLPALLHVAFTLVSQLVGVSSRLTMAMLAMVPVERSGGLSDHAALQRYVRMPSTAGEAFYQAACELYWGTAAGVAGLLLDPAAGLRLPGALGVAGGLVGLLKGSSGLMVRPVVGALDATSKCLRGFGLLCLGRRGIQGKLVRRVRAHGALDGAAAAAAAAGAGAGGSGGVSGAPGAAGLDEPDLHAALVASWQARLPALHPSLAGDTMMEVLATRSCRLLLLTRRRLLYLRASLPTRGAAAGSCSYSLRWLLECDAVDHVRGVEEALKIFLEYHGCLRVPDFKRWGKGGKGQGKAGKDDGRPGGGEAADGAAQEGGGGQQGQVVVAGSGRDVRGGDSRAVLLRLPLHHSLRCASPEVYQRVIRAVSRHLVQAAAATAAAEAAHRGHHAAAAAAAQAAEAVAGPGAGLLAGEPAASADAVLGEEAVGAAGRAQLGAQSYAELYAVV